MADVALIVGLVAIFCAVVIALATVGGLTGEREQVGKSLAAIEAFNAAPASMRKELDKPFGERVLKPFLKEDHVAIGSINSPMQCMMKEVCAQCLQRHVNPHTGEELFVFSCFNQDQHLDFVDFKNLNERLRANSIQEKLANIWLGRAFARDDMKALMQAAA